MSLRAWITSKTQDPMTDGQITQLGTFAQAAIRKSGLDRRRVQRVISCGNQFKDGIIKLVRELGIFNPFASEYTEPSKTCSYNRETLPTVALQIEAQMRVFGLTNIEPNQVYWMGEIPTEADGLMAFPSPTDLGNILGIEDPLGDGYGLLVKIFVEALGPYWWNGLECPHTTLQNIRAHDKVRTRWEALEGRVPIDHKKLRFFILPVNTGSLYQGYSARNAYMDAVEYSNRFPLGPLEVSCLLAGWSQRIDDGL